MATLNSHVDGTICWQDLGSTNQDQAMRFYDHLFGWKYEQTGPEFGNYAMAHNGEGLFVGGVGGKMQGDPTPSAWIVYFSSSDLQASCAKASALGAKVIVPPMTVGSMGHMAVAIDPTGAAFGIWQAIDFVGMQLKDENGAFAWAETYSRNANEAALFYSQLFGLECKPMQNMDNYQTLHLSDGTTVAGIMQMDDSFDASIPSHWSTYFQVPSADEAVATTISLGGKLVAEPFDTPFGRMSLVADPSGARFYVFEPAT
jgi:uncharacterized protein